MHTREQDFLNYVSLSDYRNAISLALTMDQPGRLLTLFKKVGSVNADDCVDIARTITGNPDVDAVLKTLPPTEFVKLLKHIRTWNSTATNSSVAQVVLYALLKYRPSEDLPEAYKNEATANTASLNEIVQGLIPYTERHLTRTDRLMQESFVVDYILGEMDGGLEGDDIMEVGA